MTWTERTASPWWVSSRTPPGLDLDTTNCLRLIVSEHGAAFGSDVALGDVDGDGSDGLILEGVDGAAIPSALAVGDFDGDQVADLPYSSAWCQASCRATSRSARPRS